jgi:hypothetical protein
MTKNVDAIRQLFGALNSRVGNLPSMPGIFPDYPAPIVRNAPDGRGIVMARWGMPSSSKALMDATKKRAQKLEAKGQNGGLQGVAPNRAGQRHDQSATRVAATGSAGSSRKIAVWCHSPASASSTKPKAATSGSRSTQPALSPASPVSGQLDLGAKGQGRRDDNDLYGF